jgi:hypothetical protein
MSNDSKDFNGNEEADVLGQFIAGEKTSCRPPFKFSVGYILVEELLLPRPSWVQTQICTYAIHVEMMF